MSDVYKDAMMDKFLYKQTVDYAEYSFILEQAKSNSRTKVFAKSYAESLKNTFSALKGYKERTFKNEVIKKYDNILKEYDRLKSEGEKGTAESYVKALGLMYAAFKYDSADVGFKDMIDKVKEDKPAVTEKPKAEEKAAHQAASKNIGKDRKSLIEFLTLGLIKTRKAKSVAGKSVSETPAALPATPKASTPPPAASPAGDNGKEIKAAANLPNTQKPKETKDAKGSFNLDKFNSKECTLEEINNNEFSIIEATYKKYKRFMGKKSGVYFEKDLKANPPVRVKITINGHPKEIEDKGIKYIEYNTTRQEWKLKEGVTRLPFVAGFRFVDMPKMEPDESTKIEVTKKYRLCVSGENAGKVEEMK